MKRKIFGLVLILGITAICLAGMCISSQAAAEGYYTYTVTDGEATITDCSASIKGSVTVPSKLGGYPVTGIGNSAFYGCVSLTEVIIPNSVVSIGASAFYECSRLVKITIPEGVTSIGSYMFRNCISLTEVNIPESVTSIGTYAFYGCSKLTEITIPQGVTGIENSVFRNCSSLTEVNIPESITYIGTSAFYGCSSLEEITLPEGVTYIDAAAFKECIALQQIIIPDSITDIGNQAFYNCSNLTKIEVPVRLQDSIDFANICNGAEVVFYAKIIYVKNDNVIFEDFVICGENAVLPEFEEECVFLVNGEEWTGENITENVTVTVTKKNQTYTVTYVGDYEGCDTVECLHDVTLPLPEEGYVYSFTVNGEKWTGESITGDVRVTVKKLNDDCSIFDITGLYDVSINKNTITATSYLNTWKNSKVLIREGADATAYYDQACTSPVTQMIVSRDEKQTFYIKVVAESGRSEIYTVTVTRRVVDSLGDIEFVSAVGGHVTLKVEEEIADLPEVGVQYSTNGTSWSSKTGIYDRETGLVQVLGLSENTKYWVKVYANYGDFPWAESGTIEIMTTSTVSDECDVVKVVSPINAEIDPVNNTIYARVANAFDEYEINVVVSEGATWALYRTSSATVPIENNTLSLRVGKETTAYVKVVAEDGYSQKSYKVTIYRQKKSVAPEISIVDGKVNITAADGSKILYTTDNQNPIPGLVGEEYTAPFAAENGTVIKVTALNPDCEEYSDIVIYHVKVAFVTTTEQLYLDDTGNAVEWSYYLITDNPDGIDGTFVVAVYNRDGILTGLHREVVKTSDTEVELSGVVESEDISFCRVFLWNSNETMMPLCKKTESTPEG